jgi:Response regulator containing CheY-like receiver, AAA-type ATPase, and DNA-binding domains
MNGRSILVVDDEEELRDIVGRVLRDAGHRVTTAADGKEAIVTMANEEFDLVLTDVIMPEKDGMQVISEARRKYPRVKIVAMSGGGHIPRDQYLKIATGLGAHAILEKPFSNRELMETVTAVLE